MLRLGDTDANLLPVEPAGFELCTGSDSRPLSSGLLNSVSAFTGEFDLEYVSVLGSSVRWPMDFDLEYIGGEGVNDFCLSNDNLDALCTVQGGGVPEHDRLLAVTFDCKTSRFFL